MINLPPNPTLKDFQEYEKKIRDERGFNLNREGLFAHILEEAGELANAARKFEKGRGSKDDISNESADLFMFFLNLINFYEIDIEKSFKAKEEINTKRFEEGYFK